MIALYVAPAVIALLVLAAHDLRIGNLIWTVELAVLALLLPMVRRRPMLRVAQVVLLIGAAEWVRALYAGVEDRILNERDYGRLVVILGATAAFTLVAALVLQLRGARERYPRIAERATPAPDADADATG